MYLQAKIARLQNKHVDEKTCYSDQNDYCVGDGLYEARRHTITTYNQMEPILKRRSLANDSKASVYFTPTDSVDQTQLQLSPIHINYIKENLDTFVSCLKPPSLSTKFCFDAPRLNGELRCASFDSQMEDCDSLADEMDTERTAMMTTENDSSNEDNCAMNQNTDYIHLKTLSKRKLKNAQNSKDFYYSLENVFDGIPSGSIYQQMQLSNKTIDEVSETQGTNTSASDNCITEESNSLNRLQSIDPTDSTSNQKLMPIFVNPSQSTSALFPHHIQFHFHELQASNSLPNIKKETAIADVHSSNEHNGKHVTLAIEPNDNECLPNGETMRQ